MNEIKSRLGSLWTKLVRSTDQLSAKLAVKGGYPVVKPVLDALALLGRRLTPSTVFAVVAFASECNRLQKMGGTRFMVIYLKAATSMLQQSLGGQTLESLNPFGVRVSRTGSGLPRMIPAEHRARIRSGEVFVIRLWMTLFGIYRICSFQGKVKLNTITDPSTFDPIHLGRFSTVLACHYIPALVKHFGRHRDTILAAVMGDGEDRLDWMRSRLRARPFIISKSGPSIRPENAQVGAQSTSPASILESAYLWTQSPLFPMLQAWCKMTGSTWVLNRIEMWTSIRWIWEGGKPLSQDGPDTPFLGSGHLGKLGFKDEPGGKVRVFAMVDPWTQWIFDPLHRAIFNLLRYIPQDGTFNQIRPIDILLRRQARMTPPGAKLPPLFSYDLSAATDRIPISLQKVLLSPFLGSWGAEVWAALLVSRPYSVPSYPKAGVPKATEVHYGCGQPMGALSSWAMLAFVHHFIVQCAALAAGAVTPGVWFRDYAVLGDDIVIMGSAVANKYRALMKMLGVEIGDHKSLVSHSGLALEFAKRTFYKGDDVSMVPFPEHVVGTQNISGVIALATKYNLSLASLMTALGYGYKAKASVNKRLVSLSRRLRNYILAFYGPSGPAYRSLRTWFGMHSIPSLYKDTLDRVNELFVSLLDQETALLKEKLLSLEPLVSLAKKLGTTYRDREHYGTTPRTGINRTTELHPGMAAIDPFETIEGMRIVDSLNETVYRDTFVEVPCNYRDLLAKLEEFDATTQTWESVHELWDMFEAIQTDLGALPLPSNLHTRAGDGKPSTTIGENLKRWYRHSGIFRRTHKKSEK